MIFVTGATGHTGRAVVCKLASPGHDVVAMVRDVQAARRGARHLGSPGALRTMRMPLQAKRQVPRSLLPAGQGLAAPISPDEVATAIVAIASQPTRLRLPLRRELDPLITS